MPDLKDPSPAETDSLEAFHVLDLELSRAEGLGEFYRLVVERGRELLDIDRLALLLYDRETNMERGTWGTDPEGRVVDESDRSRPIPPDDRIVRENLRRRNFLTIEEDRELRDRDRVVGKGWEAVVSLWNGDEIVGWLAADNLLRGLPLLSHQRWLLVSYGHLVADHLIRKRRSEDRLDARTPPAAEDKRREEGPGRPREEADDGTALKERLFRIFAHDLRGPLGTVRDILGRTEAESATFSGEEIGALLPEIRGSINATFFLLENLLDWVRSEIAGVVAPEEDLAPADLVGSVVDDQTAAADEKGLVVEVEIPATARVRTDARILEAILRNLLSNAIKYTPSAGRIRVGYGRDEAGAASRITVDDEGIGMSPEQLARIFTLDSAKKREGTRGERGSGIGLVFCSELARRIGATIEAESVPGKGSVFTLTLPDAGPPK
jgi:signal transduction histidine kinase